jgi:lipopolysaccharide export LptBFGC system permease protein LptF
LSVSRRTRSSIVVLILFAAYSVFVIVRAIAAEGHGSVFWAQIGVIVVLAVAALLLSRWLHRRNRARPNS